MTEFDVAAVDLSGILNKTAEDKAKQLPDPYKDTTRFPSGPSCKEGDFIIVRPNSGTRLKIHGREFRILNDDSVEAVVEDPRGITRAS
jgi:co-chaperonin GroES (HSP10)